MHYLLLNDIMVGCDNAVQSDDNTWLFAQLAEAIQHFTWSLSYDKLLRDICIFFQKKLNWIII